MFCLRRLRPKAVACGGAARHIVIDLHDRLGSQSGGWDVQVIYKKHKKASPRSTEQGCSRGKVSP